MTEFQEKNEGFLRDLLLTVPYFQGYEMIDWLILAVSIAGFLTTSKNRLHGLVLLSIADALWGAYDLFQGEYAQGLLFFFYFGLTAWSCHSNWKNAI